MKVIIETRFNPISSGSGNDVDTILATQAVEFLMGRVDPDIPKQRIAFTATRIRIERYDKRLAYIYHQATLNLIDRCGQICGGPIGDFSVATPQMWVIHDVEEVAIAFTEGSTVRGLTVRDKDLHPKNVGLVILGCVGGTEENLMRSTGKAAGLINATLLRVQRNSKKR